MRSNFRKIKKLTVLLCFAACLLLGGSEAVPDELREAPVFLPWAVGQYAEYRIIGFDDIGRENRYRISLAGKEVVDNEVFFWIEYEIFNLDRREIAFKALVREFRADDLYSWPERWIAEGVLVFLKNANRLIVVNSEGQEREVLPNDFFNNPEVPDYGFYKKHTEENSRVNYRKLQRARGQAETPAGIFRACDHFSVATAQGEAFTDTGFDLWRTSDVPFFGIVRVEFSKTKFREKSLCRQDKIRQNNTLLDRFYRHFFVDRAQRVGIKDSYYLIELVEYRSNGSRPEDE